MPSIAILHAELVNQDTVPHSQDASIELIKSIDANVPSAAVDVMAAQIDGSTMNSVKQSSAPRYNDLKKSKLLYFKIDKEDLLFNLINNVQRYLELISSVDNVNSPSIDPTVKVLKYSVLRGKK